MHYFTVEDIVRIHYRIIVDFGGSHGVRSEAAIDSIVMAPQQSVFGQDQYSSVYEKAAVYARNIIGDHPFSDGNKRTAVTIVGIFMKRNGKALTATPLELEDFAVQVAVEHLDVAQIAAWLKEHSN